MASDDGPPHMIKKYDSGIDIDIARQVLQKLGYRIQVEYYNLSRGKRNVEEGKIDAVTPIFFEKDRKGFYVSAPTVDYKPTIFTLKKKIIRSTKS